MENIKPSTVFKDLDYVANLERELATLRTQILDLPGHRITAKKAHDADVERLEAELESVRGCDKYNGWTNYPTWAVNLWLANEESSYIHWAEQARDVVVNFDPEPLLYIHGDPDTYRYRRQVDELAKRLKDDHDDGAFEAKLPGVLSDLLSYALGRVDFFEIAEHLIEDAKEQVGEDE